MADYAEALSAGPKPGKKPKNELMHIALSKAENGGVIAEHRMKEWGGKEPKFAFGANEGGKLAAHLTKHLGMHIPAAGGGAESEEEEA